MEALSPLEKKLLLFLEKHNGKAQPGEIEMELVKVMNAASWLQSKGLVEMEEKLIKEYEITKEGEKFLAEGLPEKKWMEKFEASIWRKLKKKWGAKKQLLQ